MASTPKWHNRAKHIRIGYHFVRECVALKELVVRDIPSTENVADLMTKSLHRPTHETLVKLIGMTPRTRGSVVNESSNAVAEHVNKHVSNA